MVLLIAAALIGLMAYIRLAPSDVLRWHISPPQNLWAQGEAWDQVVRLQNGAILRLSSEPRETLEKLDQLALATPRTHRLAGDVASGRITWVTRSAVWGFPDYTTAEVRPDGLYVYARLRFGNSDLGVNFARLSSWFAAH